METILPSEYVTRFTCPFHGSDVSTI